MITMTFTTIRERLVPSQPAHSLNSGKRWAIHTAPRLVVVALLLMVTGFAGAGPTPADAAVAAPRLGRIVHVYAQSATNSQSPKDATAECPAGWQVLGGGGAVVVSGPAGPEIAKHVALTQLEPYTAGTHPQGYRVRAEEAAPGSTGDWTLGAEAICSEDPVPGHHIVGRNTEWSSESVQANDAICPDGERVLGTGARITYFNADQRQGIGLQVARADALGGLTRAQAHEQPSGYAFDWRLRAFAVCADPVDGYEVRSGGSGALNTEPAKQARATCSTSSRRMISAGAAVGSDVPGNVTLNRADTGGSPSGDEELAIAYENTPTSANWDLVARGICVA